MKRALGNISCDLDAKVKGQIMYFLVNLSLKLFDIQLQTLQVHISHDVEDIGQYFVWVNAMVFHRH